MNRKIKIIIIAIASIFIVSVVLFFALRGKGGSEYVTAKVERGNLVQTVSETGTVKSAQEIELNFSQSGKLDEILVKIGDKVKAGDILAKLDYSSLLIKQKEAQANLEVAQANLNKLLSGATSHEIAVSQANVNKARAAYLAAVDNLDKTKKTVAENIAQAEKTLNDLESNSPADVTAYEQAVSVAQTNLDNTKNTYSQTVSNRQESALSYIEDKLAAANTALDAVDSVLNSSFHDLLSSQDITYLDNANEAYDSALSWYSTANSSFLAAENDPTNDNINQALNDSIICLNKVFDSLNYCYGALENTASSPSLTQTTIDSYKTTISTQITTIGAAVTTLETAKQNLNDAILAYNTNVSAAEENLLNAQAGLDDAVKSARNSLSSARINGDQTIAASQAEVDNAYEAWNIAEAQLAELKAPPTSQDLALYRAQVKQAQAALDLTRQQIDDSIIKAPIDGTIVKTNYEVGEQITAGGLAAADPVITMLAENNFEIKIDISEADISKIKKGDKAVIDLDAFGEDVKFFGMVSFIEPAETVIQEVIYYKVTVVFTADNESNPYYSGIKPGMTANVTITTAEKNNVLLVPGRAILEKNGAGKYIRILSKGDVKEVPVKVGLRGDEGVVEVLSGVNEGDEVVTYVKEKK